jgi:hypothetical protein
MQEGRASLSRTLASTRAPRNQLPIHPREPGALPRTYAELGLSRRPVENHPLAPPASPVPSPGGFPLYTRHRLARVRGVPGGGIRRGPSRGVHRAHVSSAGTIQVRRRSTTGLVSTVGTVAAMATEAEAVTEVIRGTALCSVCPRIAAHRPLRARPHWTTDEDHRGNGAV